MCKNVKMGGGGADQKEGFTKKLKMPHFFIVLSTKLKQLLLSIS